MELMSIIDLSPYYGGDEQARRQVADAIGHACESLGFFGIVGHRVPTYLMTDLSEVSRMFFEQPMEAKRSLFAATPRAPHGYMTPDAERLGIESAPNLPEAFTASRFTKSGDIRGLDGPRNIWPDIPQFRDIWRASFDELASLASDIAHLFALALRLEATWFDDKLDQQSSGIVASYYPPSLPGQFRHGAHTDYGDFTIHLQPDGPCGLQVRDQTGEWHNSPTVPGGFIVNIGDLMARWTNDAWISALHRIVAPEDDTPRLARMAFTFFHSPNRDTLIECIPTTVNDHRPAKYSPVIAGEWIRLRLGKH